MKMMSNVVVDIVGGIRVALEFDSRIAVWQCLYRYICVPRHQVSL